MKCLTLNRLDKCLMVGFETIDETKNIFFTDVQLHLLQGRISVQHQLCHNPGKMYGIIRCVLSFLFICPKKSKMFIQIKSIYYFHTHTHTHTHRQADRHRHTRTPIHTHIFMLRCVTFALIISSHPLVLFVLLQLTLFNLKIQLK